MEEDKEVLLPRGEEYIFGEEAILENDIKILEDFIKYYEAEAISRNFRGTLSISVDEQDIQALENLLTRYKEIKTEHKIMKRILVEHNLWETLLNDDEFIKHLEEE